ncbi:MAG: PAS domain-containing protein [Anaerolineales bacterium]|nr:PAS domain-containing protein [Anaerolineales bacterium]
MDQLKRDWLFELLGRIAEGIIAVVGPYCEVVVYDFADLEHAIVSVAGDLTDRQPGAPVPDLEFIRTSLKNDSPDEINYTQKGDHQFLSYTVWVRDPAGEIIGAVGINMDYDHILQMKAIVDSLTSVFQQKSDLLISNTFARSLDELLQNTVREFLQQESIHSIDELTLQDKQHLIEIVEDRGLFKIRGAAQRLADLLNVSRASIYNYRAGAGVNQES